MRINCGVPQGSILGPLLFLIYINDLASVSNILTSLLFADDTTLTYNGKNLPDIIATFNSEMNRIVHWLNANRLSLNLDKTYFMVFRPKGKNLEPPDIIVNNIKIKQVEEFKFLGVIIDNQLNWFEHIKYISSKISKGIGVIIKARKSFDTDTLLSLYNTLIFPYISYCIHVWGTAAEIHIRKIHILQKKIVRIICGLPPRDSDGIWTSTKSSFIKKKILNVYQIYDYFIALFMYKLSHDNLPPLFDMFERTSNIHNYETRQHNLFYLKFVPTSRSQKTIKIKGTKLWNMLVRKMDTDCAISTFKTKLKTLIITDDYSY